MASGSDNQPDLTLKFTSYTTCHGLGRIGDATHIAQRVFWVLLVLAAFALCSWQITERIINYAKYETSTQLKKTYQVSLPFPAVTFCSYNKFSLSKLRDEDMYVVSSSSLFDVSDGITPYSELLQMAKEAEGNITLLYQDGFDYSNFSRRVGWQFEFGEAIIMCFFNGHQCTRQDFTPTLTKMGVCYTFNANNLEAERQTKSQHEPGSKFGLEIVINSQQEDYAQHLELVSSSAIIRTIHTGVKFRVHAQQEYPDLEASGYAVSPGFHAYAAIKNIEFTNLEPPWVDCDPGHKLKYQDVYTLDACFQECYQVAVETKCGCRMAHRPGDAEVCMPVTILECVAPEMHRLSSSLESCPQCNEPCVGHEYPVSLSYATFPSKNTESFLAAGYNLSLSYIRENTLWINVYYDSIVKEEVIKNPSVEMSALISDIGGQLGFFVGISVLTLSEFVELLFLKIILACTKKREPSSTKPNNTGFSNDNFIISKTETM